jgi:hypothetical protein
MKAKSTYQVIGYDDKDLTPDQIIQAAKEE